MTAFFVPGTRPSTKQPPARDHGHTAERCPHSPNLSASRSSSTDTSKQDSNVLKQLGYESIDGPIDDDELAELMKTLGDENVPLGQRYQIARNSACSLSLRLPTDGRRPNRRYAPGSA